MVTTAGSFITQMKLRALREQRSRLLRTYHELRQQVAQEPTEAGRLGVLYEGLRQITFANQQLHADVTNLEPLLGRADDGSISLETIIFWRERLEKELASGQLRAEIVYLFGSLLEEWASGTTETAETSAQREQHWWNVSCSQQKPVPMSPCSILCWPRVPSVSRKSEHKRSRRRSARICRKASSFPSLPSSWNT
jgi:hypothetical protein